MPEQVPFHVRSARAGRSPEPLRGPELDEGFFTNPRSMAFLAHIANALLLAALFALALWTFQRLPDTFPTHFDASGAPDRISERSFAEWMILSLCALGTTIFIYATTLFVHVVRRRPHLLNIQGKLKKRYVALPPERREPILAVVRAFTFWVAVPTNGLMIWLQWVVYRAAVEGGMSDSSVWAMMISFSAVLIAMCVGFYVWMKRAIERAEGASP